MNKEVTIEAVKVKHKGCNGCIFQNQYGMEDCSNFMYAIDALELEGCVNGFIYKIKEK